MTTINRRGALRAVGASVGALLVSNAVYAASEPVTRSMPNPDDPAMVDGVEAWKFAKIDPQSVADQAYNDYPVGHCMHTTFKAIVDHVADALETSDPLAARAMKAFPFHMFHYGSSGGDGLGSLCGSLNGAMAAINLFVSNDKVRKAITNELAIYYERTLLPVYVPDDAKNEPFPRTVANSVLCHVSSGKWCELAQVRSGSPERTERCSRLSADVAKKAAELLNLNMAALNSADLAPVVSLKRSEPTATCVKCHDKGGDTGNVIGKMTCGECHPEKTPDHHDRKE